MVSHVTILEFLCAPRGRDSGVRKIRDARQAYGKFAVRW